MKRYDLNLFSTPVIVAKTEDEDLLEKFCSIVRNHKQKTENDPSSINLDPHQKNYVSNTDGYTSFYKGSLLKKEEFISVIEYLDKVIKKVISDKEKTKNFNLEWLDCWYTIYDQGNNVEEHFHPNSIISGVYYLKCPDNCGDIIFNDSNYHYKNFCLNTSPLKTFTYQKSFNLTPEDGMIVLFPSWLLHKTEFNKSNEERIIIAFNLIPTYNYKSDSNLGSNSYHIRNYGKN